MGAIVNEGGEQKKITDIYINVSGEKKRCTSAWKKEAGIINKIYAARRNVWAWIDKKEGKSCIAYTFLNKYVYSAPYVEYVFPSGDETEEYRDIRFFHGSFYTLCQSGKVYKSDNLVDWILLEGAAGSADLAGRFYRTKSRLFIVWTVSNITSTKGKEQYTRYCLKEDESDFVSFEMPGDYKNDLYKSPVVDTAYLTWGGNFFENEEEDTLNFFFYGNNTQTKMQTVVAYSLDAKLKATKRIETCESYQKYSAGGNNLLGWYDENEKNTYLYMGTASNRTSLLVFPLRSVEYSKVPISSSPGYDNSSADTEIVACKGITARLVKTYNYRHYSKSFNNMRSIIKIQDDKEYLGEYLRAVDNYIFLYDRYGRGYLNWIDVDNGENYRSGYGTRGAIDKGVIE